MSFRGILIVLVVVYVQNGWAFPGGAPKLACKSMTPVHGVNAQNETSPFTLTLSATSVKSSSASVANETSSNTTTEAGTTTPSSEEQQITVTLGSPDQNKFKGFFVQARNSENQSVGTFKVVKGPGAFLDCGKGAHSTVTHTNRHEKTAVVLTWLPPTDFSGDVVFHATVVEKFTVFHTGIKSSSLAVSNSA